MAWRFESRCFEKLCSEVPKAFRKFHMQQAQGGARDDEKMLLSTSTSRYVPPYAYGSVHPSILHEFRYAHRFRCVRDKIRTPWHARAGLLPAQRHGPVLRHRTNKLSVTNSILQACLYEETL